MGALNPHHSGLFYFLPFFYHYRKREYSEAECSKAVQHSEVSVDSCGDCCGMRPVGPSPGGTRGAQRSAKDESPVPE